MKIFKSLNCLLCQIPFVPVANQSRSPRTLECGEAMCNECFEEEKPLNPDQRKHQCQKGDECFQNPNFASFLIDILSQDSLKLSPMELRYILVKPFQPLECHICREEYSSNLGTRNSPVVLRCNHAICTKCYREARKQHAIENDRNFICPGDPVKCPVCQQEVTSTFDKTPRSRLQDFLAELPAMTCQLKEISSTNHRFCEDCNKMDIVDEMFYCDENECQKKLCAICVVRKHRFHNVSALLETEATELSDELQKVSTNEIETYKGIFPEMHKELVGKIDTFKTKLLSKEETLKKAANFEDLRNKHEKCTKLKKDFETISEEYLPCLRKYDFKVTELITCLDKDPY